MLHSSKTRVVAAAALLLAGWWLLPEPAGAWSAGGHRVVANIAYDRLDQATRSEIVKVLKKHEDFKKRFKDEMPEDIQKASAEDQDRWIFLQASIWPDLIRSVPKYHKETWHFVNMPFYLSALDQATLQGVIKPNVSNMLPNPLTPAARDQLNCIQAFKLCVRELTDADTTDQEKAIFFCWLMHIAGDMHQPMHSTSLISRGRFHASEGDRGGNGIKIKQGKNLHSYWDGLLGKEQPLNDIRGRAKDILQSDELKKAAEDATEQLVVEVWVQESHTLAKEFAYDKLILKEVAEREADATKSLGKVDLPTEYLEKAGKLAQRRVAEAGYRLAEILKQVTD